MNKFISLIKTKKQTIVSVVILFFAITAIFTFAQPLKYYSESSVLVVQNFPPGIDQFTMSKSNEYISNILAKVVSSNLFYNDVLKAGFNIDRNYFSKNDSLNAEMDEWKRTVQAKAISDTGIIDINVYHPDKQQLNQIAMAVNYVLQSSHGQYHGQGGNATIKIIDKPIISVWPAQPNIILNLLLAMAVGLIVSLYYIYLFQEESYNLRLWPRFKSRNSSHQLADSKEREKALKFDRGLNFQPINQEMDFPPQDNINLAPPNRENYQAAEAAIAGADSDREAEDKSFSPRGSVSNLF